jgi:hypothetical protein
VPIHSNSKSVNFCIYSLHIAMYTYTEPHLCTLINMSPHTVVYPVNVSSSSFHVLLQHSNFKLGFSNNRTRDVYFRCLRGRRSFRASCGSRHVLFQGCFKILCPALIEIDIDCYAGLAKFMTKMGAGQAVRKGRDSFLSSVISLSSFRIFWYAKKT